MIALLVAAVFSQAGKAQFVNWDDPDYILKNETLRVLSWGGLFTIFSQFQVANYHPLTTLTWAIEYQLHGTNPAPYHWLNVLLHCANTVLSFFLAKKLTKSLWPAALVSLFFGIHPMHVESVAWISERKDLLYTLFFLASLISYSNYLENRKRTQHYFLSLMFFALSLLSKSAAVVLPLVLWLLDYYYDRKFDKKVLYEKVPFLVLSLLFGILAMLAQRSVNAVNTLADYTLLDRAVFVSYALAYYLLSVIVPLKLSAVHFYPEKANGMLPWFFYAAPLVLGSVGYAVVKLRSFRKELVFGLLFFLINIVLVLQLIPLGRSIVSERYTYVPYLGLFLLLALTWQRVADAGRASPILVYRAPVVFLSLLALTFSVMTWNRTKVWNNSESLFRDIMKKYPEHYFGYYYTAVTLYESGKYHEAIGYFDQSLRYDPEDHEAWNNRGNAKFFIKDYDGALSDLTQAIKVLPDFPEAYHNRGSVFATLQNYPPALSDYSEALALRPDYTDAYYNRGLVYKLIGDYENAISDFSKAIELEPQLAKALYERGVTKINLNRISEGCEDLRIADQMGFELAATLLKEYCAARK